jgi:hypothetical protein
MRKRILVLLVGVVMALTMVAAPVSAHSGSYDGSHHDGSYYKDGPFCHWYGHGYEVVWGKSHYYHGDYRAKEYYDDYSCRYLYDDHRGYGHDDGFGYGLDGFGLTASASVGFGY